MTTTSTFHVTAKQARNALTAITEAARAIKPALELAPYAVAERAVRETNDLVESVAAELGFDIADMCGDCGKAVFEGEQFTAHEEGIYCADCFSPDTKEQSS